MKTNGFRIFWITKTGSDKKSVTICHGAVFSSAAAWSQASTSDRQTAASQSSHSGRRLNLIVVCPVEIWDILCITLYSAYCFNNWHGNVIICLISDPQLWTHPGHSFLSGNQINDDWPLKSLYRSSIKIYFSCVKSGRFMAYTLLSNDKNSEGNILRYSGAK